MCHESVPARRSFLRILAPLVAAGVVTVVVAAVLAPFIVLTGCADESSDPPAPSDDPELEIVASWASSEGALQDGRFVIRAAALPAPTDTLVFEHALVDGAATTTVRHNLAPAAGYHLRVDLRGRLDRPGGPTAHGLLFSADTLLGQLAAFDRVDLALALSPLVPSPRYETVDGGLRYRLSWNSIGGSAGYQLEERRNSAPALAFEVARSETTLTFPPVRVGMVGSGGALGATYRVRSHLAFGEPPVLGAWSESLRVEFPPPIPPADVTDLAVLSSFTTEQTIRLSWTAPGDDGMEGRAEVYDLRVSRTPLDSVSFFGAPSYRLSPPSQPFFTENREILGLESGTTYYMALRTADEGRHWSAISNVVSETTRAVADTLPPQAVTDLRLSAPGERAILLEWTTPADHDGSPVSAYEIRYGTDPIDSMSFELALEAPELPVPASPGSAASLLIGNLASEQIYYAALRSRDTSNNVSPLSNVGSVATPDLTSPVRITDLAARGANAVQVSITWTAPGDDGRFGLADRYDLRWSLEPLDDANFPFATPIEGLAPPLPGETFEARVLDRSGLPASAFHLAIRTFDNAGNVSDVSNDATVGAAAATASP